MNSYLSGSSRRKLKQQQKEIKHGYVCLYSLYKKHKNGNEYVHFYTQIPMYALESYCCKRTRNMYVMSVQNIECDRVAITDM